MSQAPILIALGANLPSRAGGPRDTLEAALRDLNSAGVVTRKRSRWFMTPPWPVSDQPWYVNGVAAVATALDPAALLQALHAVETAFGRVRGVPNAARTLDLDLLAYGDVVQPDPSPGAPVLPHPRLGERAFVLLPLADVASDWRHPVTGRSVRDLVADLTAGGGDVSAVSPLE